MNSIKEDQKPSNKKLLFYTFLALLLVWALYMLVPQIFREKTGRLIFDNYDYSVYFERGKWFTEKSVPLSEYPQIPTYLFGLNNIFSMGFAKELQPAIYICFMSLEMILALFFMLKILFELVPEEMKNLPFLMLLPTTLYFVLNRFDILPSLFCLLAFNTLRKKHFVASSILLAVATFTKWYPVLLFPGFLFYSYSLEPKIPRKMILAFVITSLIIVTPTFIQGGMEAVLLPYKFHIARGMEFYSFVVLMNDILNHGLNISFNSESLYLPFFILQISAPVASVFIKLDRLDSVKQYSIFAIAIFILFSRVNSPQWILWLMPFLIISARGKSDVFLIALYSFLTYITFPLIFTTLSYTSLPYKFVSALDFIILGIIIIRSLKKLSFSLDNFSFLTKKKLA